MELKVIKGDNASTQVGKCVVTSEGSKVTFTDFVVVGMNGPDITLIQNTDPATLGIALTLVRRAFEEAFEQLNEKQQELITDFFKGGTI